MAVRPLSSTPPSPAISPPAAIYRLALSPTRPSCHLFSSSSSNFSSRFQRRRDSAVAPAFPFSAPPPRPQSPRVSTEPVEQATSSDFADAGFKAEIARLHGIRSLLGAAAGLEEKHRVLDADNRVRDFFGAGRGGGAALRGLGSEEVLLLKCLVAAGQEHVLGGDLDWGGCWGDIADGAGQNGRNSVLRSALLKMAQMVDGLNFDRQQEPLTMAALESNMGLLKKLLRMLQEVEQFYNCIGGIIGYQITSLELISATEDMGHHAKQGGVLDFHVPSGLNLAENTEYARQAVLWGLEGLPELGEIYPIGGAGDRLGLVDPYTGECLPAALLPYGGRTLLEGLIRDLQAREFLYFKIFGKQCITPIAIMTSSAKNNHEHISALCASLNWFGRGCENFQLFEQPLVPVVAAEDGKWLTSRSLLPVCKPGGHGAIWKLAYDKGVFQWFGYHRRKGATVRQVSNVVAATDLTLIALAGIGLRQKKKLGFASCERNRGATEGINVLVEKENTDGRWSYGITCIEYVEFEKYQISETLDSPISLQDSFPANTNILYIDLQAAEEVGSSRNASCLPGMVLNLKKVVSYVNHLGFECRATGGRLECTMQNIADNFMNTYSLRCRELMQSDLDTFIVYNERKKVTSSAKRKRKPQDKSLHQTPDGALLDVTRNAHDLLSSCGIKLPKVGENSEYLHSGPPFLIHIHPAMGPLWDITRQKFSGGSISEGSEFVAEVAEFLWREVELDGSLIVMAENVMGSTLGNQNQGGEQILKYGARCGRCKLQKVKIRNKGIDWDYHGNVYWKSDIRRHESLKIILHGNAEFEATDVVLQGNHVFEVPDGHKMLIVGDKGGFAAKLDRIPEELMETGSWYWKYTLDDGANIILDLVDQQQV